MNYSQPKMIRQTISRKEARKLIIEAHLYGPFDAITEIHAYQNINSTLFRVYRIPATTATISMNNDELLEYVRNNMPAEIHF